jgi:hypothetical protein
MDEGLAHVGQMRSANVENFSGKNLKLIDYL